MSETNLSGLSIMAKQAIIYERFSPRPDADESKSNEKQEERCRAHCERKGYEVVGVFPDKNISGGLLERPELSKAIAALKPGMVFVADTTRRLARDMFVYLVLRQQIESAGATIEFADGSPCDATPESRLFQNVLAAFAQYDRERFAARTKAGLAKKRAQGMHVGRVPVGHRIDKATGKLVPDEWEQKAMERACQCAGARMKSEDIAAVLTQEFGPFRSKPWNARTVRKFLLMIRRSENV